VRSLRDEGKNCATEASKGRSQMQKVGKFRYLNRKVDRLAEEVKKLRSEQEARFRILFNALRPLFAEVDSDFILDVVCRDEGDVALLDHLRSKGNQGITPTEASAAKELRRFKFKPYHITRRIQRMNSRLQRELGKHVAESYARRWVLTAFVERAFGLGEEDLEEELEARS
jgi:septal ring factor EnvC (AmiA/AmiB activator)